MLPDIILDILKNGRIQRVLRALKDGVLSSIEPTVNFDSGIDYPSLHGFFDSVDEASRSLLMLCEAGLLTSEVVDNVAVCPVCQSHRLMIRMRCPSCSSSKLTRGAMIEHLACGHIDFEERFKSGNGLVCPRCGKPLGSIGSDYRTFSFLYRCLACRGVFSNPKVEYLCGNGHVFSEGDLSIQAIRLFRLNPNKISLLDRLMLDIEGIFKPLKDEGLIIEFPAEVYGETGIKHDFSFAVWDSVEGKGSKPPMVVGSIHASDSVVTAVDVLAFWAKALDAKAKHKIIIALSGIDKGGRELANTYGIKIIEGKSLSEAMAKARSIIEETTEAAGVEEPVQGGGGVVERTVSTHLE